MTTESTSPTPGVPGPDDSVKPLRDRVIDVLKTCYDPEIPVNIVDLGLVYDMGIEPLPSGHRYWHHASVTVLPHISGPTSADTAAVIAAAASRDRRKARDWTGMRMMGFREAGECIT